MFSGDQCKAFDDTVDAFDETRSEKSPAEFVMVGNREFAQKRAPQYLKPTNGCQALPIAQFLDCPWLDGNH
jgi:hypothetical protein